MNEKKKRNCILRWSLENQTTKQLCLFCWQLTKYSRQTLSSDWSSQSTSPSHCHAPLMHIPESHWNSPRLQFGLEPATNELPVFTATHTRMAEKPTSEWFFLRRMERIRKLSPKQNLLGLHLCLQTRPFISVKASLLCRHFFTEMTFWGDNNLFSWLSTERGRTRPVVPFFLLNSGGGRQATILDLELSGDFKSGVTRTDWWNLRQEWPIAEGKQLHTCKFVIYTT